MSTFDDAIVLARRGYAIHWVRYQHKAPIAEGWSTAPVATVTDLRQTYKPGYNLGVRCGHWSQPLPGHGLVILDTDIRDPEATGPALAAVEALVGDIRLVPTVLSGSGNGSRHLWFACPMATLPPKANTTVEQGESWKIEALSTGKQCVAPPSIHPSGQAYRWLIPPSTVPLLPQTVHAAIDAALHARVAPMPPSERLHGVSHTEGNRPGDDFNRRASWQDILGPYGWVPVRHHGEVTYWRRPGKDEGVSGTTNYGASGLLYVFSTNAAPFEADTGYSLFAAHTLLEHGGDFGAAARDLAAQGYGVQSHAHTTAYQRRQETAISRYKKQIYTDPYFGSPKNRARGITVARVIYKETSHE